MTRKIVVEPPTSPTVSMTVEKFRSISKLMETYVRIKEEKHRFANSRIAMIAIHEKGKEPCGPQCLCVSMRMMQLKFENPFINEKVQNTMIRAIIEGLDGELIIVMDKLAKLGITDLNTDAVAPEPDPDESEEDEEPTAG